MTERRTTSYSEHYSTNQNTELQREYDRRKLRESRREAQLRARKKGLVERPGESAVKQSRNKTGRLDRRLNKSKKPKKVK